MQTRQWIHNIFGVDIRIRINLEIRIRILDHFPFTFCSWQSVCSLSALAVYATEMVNQVMLAVNSNIKLETIWINLSVDCHTFLIQLNLDLTFLLYYWCSLSNWLPVPKFLRKMLLLRRKVRRRDVTRYMSPHHCSPCVLEYPNPACNFDRFSDPSCWKVRATFN